MASKKSSKKQKMTGKSRKYLFPAIVLAIIIIGILAAVFILKSTDEDTAPYSNVTDIVKNGGEIVSYRYNNFDFAKKDGIWYTEIQEGGKPYIIAFKYGPLGLENLKIEYKENLFPALTTPLSRVYLTFDHDTTQASYIATAAINMISNMKTVWSLKPARACLVNSTSCKGAPVVTCKSSPDNAVIQFIESNTTKVLYEGNCLTIEAEGNDFIRAADKVILDWYGIV